MRAWEQFSRPLGLRGREKGATKPLSSATDTALGLGARVHPILQLQGSERAGPGACFQPRPGNKEKSGKTWAVRQGFERPQSLCYDPLCRRGLAWTAPALLTLAPASILNVSVSDVENSDESLMLRFAAGENACFEELVRRYQGPMLSFIGRRIKPRARAEELLQEVFVRVVKSRQRYTVQSKFRTWLYTIARNICVDEVRRRSRRPQTIPNSGPQDHKGDERPRGVDTLKSAAHSPESKAQDQEILARIELALDTLPEEQREVFVLRQIQGLSFAEIAEVVEVSQNTVKSRMRYALEKIRVLLTDLSPQKDTANSTEPGTKPKAPTRAAMLLNAAPCGPSSSISTGQEPAFAKENLDG